jgi:hypothetical protein
MSAPHQVVEVKVARHGRLRPRFADGASSGALDAVDRRPRTDPRFGDDGRSPMTEDPLGVDSIAAALRAATADDLADIRGSFEAVAADPDAPDWWRALARLAALAIDRMPAGVDPAVTLAAFDGDLTAAREALLAGDDVLAASRSRARRRRRGPP